MTFGLGCLAAWAAALLSQQQQQPELQRATPRRPLVVVAAAPPFDGQRLADALGAYLDERGVEVAVGPPVEAATLEERIAALRGTGDAASALAAVGVQRAPASIEIALVDLVTKKSLVSVMAPQREADLYRTVALKIQALLRATASEPAAGVESSPPMARLAAGDQAGEGDAAEAGRGGVRPWLGAGYLLWAFAPAGLTTQGLAVDAGLRVGGRFALSLGSAAMTSVRQTSGDVSLAANILPLRANVLARLRPGRLQLWAGLGGEVALVDVSATSPTTPVRSTRAALAAVGARVEGRLAVGSGTWLAGWGAFSAVVLGDRFTVAGAPTVDMSAWLGAMGFGVGVALR